MSSLPWIAGIVRVPHGLAGWVLPLMMACTLSWLIIGEQSLQQLARLLVVVYLVQQWPRILGLAKLLLLVSVAVALLTVFFTSQPGALIGSGLDQMAFYATFIGSVGMLRNVASQSALIRQCGKVIICQPPKWRYPLLAFGTTVFGMVLNFGVLSLLGTMVQKGNTLDAAHGLEVVRNVRQQRMSLAIIRGFALAPLVSPMGVTLALILANFPELTWGDLFPLALSVAVLLFFIGWALDRTSWPRQSAALLPPVEPLPLTPLWRFSLLVLGIVLFAFGMAHLLAIRLPLAVMMTAPLSALIWMAWQRRRLNGGSGVRRAMVRISRDSAANFGGMRGEVAVMAAAGFIGHVLINVVHAESLAGWLASVNLQGAPLAIVAFLLVVLGAQIGFNPMISVILLCSFMSDLSALEIQPAVMAVALMTGWSLAMISSPMTVSMMMMARVLGITAVVLGYRWNGRFQLLVIPTVALFLSLASWFLRQ